MARCQAFFNAQNGNSTTLPFAGLMAPAGNDLILREIGVFNDGTTATKNKLSRVTAAGTSGSTITAANTNLATHTILGTAKNLWTVTPTFGADLADMPCGAAAGAGTILTFYGEGNGLWIPAGTGNGIVLVQVAAVSQAVSGYFIWDE
jgi:hypothetical protein